MKEQKAKLLEKKKNLTARVTILTADKKRVDGKLDDTQKRLKEVEDALAKLTAEAEAEAEAEAGK